MNRYESAKELYASLGVDTEKALNTLKDITVSVHCWQGDDVTGFTATRLSPAVSRQRVTTPVRLPHPQS